MSKLDANRVINGTFGSVLIDGRKCAEVFSSSAKVTGKTEDVTVVGSMKTGKKLMSVEHELTIKLHKVYSTMQKRIAEGIEKGVPPAFKIVSSLDDPQAYGAEAVAYTGCRCYELDLQSWEAAKKGEIELKFDFDTFEFISAISEK